MTWRTSRVRVTLAANGVDPGVQMSASTNKVKGDRVAGARLVVAASEKLGRPVPDWARELAATPDDHITWEDEEQRDPSAR